MKGNWKAEQCCLRHQPELGSWGEVGKQAGGWDDRMTMDKRGLDQDLRLIYFRTSAIWGKVTSSNRTDSETFRKRIIHECAKLQDKIQHQERDVISKRRAKTIL